MKRLALATGILGALLVLVPIGRSGEEKNLRAIIDKAIEFQGGAAKLAKFKTMNMKGAGKFYGLGEAIDFTMDMTTQDDKQVRFMMEMSIMGQNLKIAAVVNGDKGWEKVNDE